MKILRFTESRVKILKLGPVGEVVKKNYDLHRCDHYHLHHHHHHHSHHHDDQFDAADDERAFSKVGTTTEEVRHLTHDARWMNWTN